MMLLLTDVNAEGKAAEPKSTSGALIIKQSFITTVFTASGGIIRHFINNNAIGYLLAGRRRGEPHHRINCRFAVGMEVKDGLAMTSFWS
ncbi:hypothetical protein FXN80_16190 [Dickeya fangzhongdai]|uniref:hypothetical protein n=1 Tax=Dickeya fangzhongdai TaxID=1778540 RepID=UPI00136B0B1B|nr:hypothetical protein [Dickeya fangzhongdai]UMB75637.1 hypothetical protein FXN80_16190 [Dickeya fangzhongdai]